MELEQVKGKRKEPTDYKEYRFTLKEEFRCDLEGILAAAVFSYFFYRSIWAFAMLAPLILFYRKEKKRRLTMRRMERLEKEFRETLLSVNINLQAGYSMENAFMESYKDVLNLFGKSSCMAEELIIIRKGMGNGIPLVQLLLDLGNRCPGGEIQEFAEVFSIAERTGGKWQEIMKKTVDIIQEKAEIKEEIASFLTLSFAFIAVTMSFCNTANSIVFSSCIYNYRCVLFYLESTFTSSPGYHQNQFSGPIIDMHMQKREKATGLSLFFCNLCLFLMQNVSSHCHLRSYPHCCQPALLSHLHFPGSDY